MPTEIPTWDDTVSDEAIPTWDDVAPDPKFSDVVDLSRGRAQDLQTTTRGGPRVSVPSFAESEASFSDVPSEMWQNINTPMFQIPHMDAPSRPFGETPAPLKAATGVVNSLADTASFFTSPLGIATLGIGALPKLAQRAIAGAFAVHMASGLPDVATELGSEIGKPESERDIEKIFNLGTTAATQLGFTTLAGKHAVTPTPKALRLADEIGGTEFTPRITPDEAAVVNLGLTTRFQPPVLPELARTGELVNQALREANPINLGIGEAPTVPAIDLLKAQSREFVPETIATAERIQGGGESPYGKVSYRRTMETPTREPLPSSAKPKETVAVEPSTNTPVSEGQVPPPPVNPAKVTVDLWRGETKPGSPENRHSFWTENESEALTYVGGDKTKLRKEVVTFENPLIAENWMKAKDKLGVPPSFNMSELLDAAADAGYDGAIWTANKSKDYVRLGKPSPAKPPEPVRAENAQTEPPRAAASPKPAGALDSAITNIEALQKRIRGTGENLGMNVPAAILDTALEVARLTLKAGKTVTEAVDAAIEHIRKNASFDVKSKFDEGKTRDVLLGQLGSKPEKSASPIRVEGEELKMRKSAERAINSDEIPEPVRERISAAPESQYKVQPQEDVRDVVGRMTDSELGAVPAESNIFVASKLQLSKRLFDQGKFDEGYEVFQDVSKTGTDFGQNINQFKMLKGVTPFDVVKIVNQGLKKSGRDPLTKPQEQKVANEANKSIEADTALNKAKDEWLKNPTDENAKLADAAAAAAHKAEIETQKLVNQYTPKSWPKMLKAFVQGNPLTPISQVANVVGNALGAGMEVGSRGVGSMVDQVRTMFTKGDRKLSTSPVSGPISAARGAARGAKQGVEILKRGSGDVVKGESRQNLRPLRALQTAFAKNPDVPTIGGKVPFNERVRLAVEGTFGISPEVMLRLLSAADRPSYEAARARLINEQSKLNNLPPGQRSMAQKFPEMFFDRDTLKLIENESSNAVFQNKSLAISYLESLIKNNGGDWADLGFTMLVAPYRLTPWNLVGRTLIYNPLIAATRTAYYASKGNIRQAELNSGRMIVGGMLYGAGYFLYKNGLIGPSLDSRDETKKERLLAGEVIPPNHVNVSGLKRLANGGDPKFRPGDETVDLTRGGGAAGAILSSVANIGRDFEKKPEGSSPFLASLLKNSTLEQARFTVNQSFLKGVTGILDAIRDRNLEPYMNSVESMFLNVGTPNTLSTLSRATRKYAPDLKDPSEIKSFQNLAKERFGVAGLDDYFPLKRDLWGKPMLQTPEGRNAILYHLFDISKNKQVTSDPVALEIYDLWRQTASRSVIPSIPDREITIARKTIPLDSKQYERLVELTGQMRRQVMEPLVVNPEFQNLSAEDKIRVIEQVYRNGAEAGKALFDEETPPNQFKEANRPKAGFKP